MGKKSSIIDTDKAILTDKLLKEAIRRLVRIELAKEKLDLPIADITHVQDYSFQAATLRVISLDGEEKEVSLGNQGSFENELCRAVFDYDRGEAIPIEEVFFAIESPTDDTKCPDLTWKRKLRDSINRINDKYSEALGLGVVFLKYGDGIVMRKM